MITDPSKSNLPRYTNRFVTKVLGPRRPRAQTEAAGPPELVYQKLRDTARLHQGNERVQVFGVASTCHESAEKNPV